MIELFCKFCKKVTQHLDLGEDIPCRWKCMLCGEYNRKEKKNDN